MGRLNNIGIAFAGINAVAISLFGSFNLWRVVYWMPANTPLLDKAFFWYVTIIMSALAIVSIVGTTRNIIDTIKEWNKP